jgi:hypothetical protein
MGRQLILALAAGAGFTLSGCGGGERSATAGASTVPAADAAVADKLSRYTPVRLTADLSKLTTRERSMLPLLIDAARTMDTIFWRQFYPARDSLLGAVSDSSLRRLIVINAGPWDALDGDKPLLAGIGPRPAGAEFYPHDMTKEEFEKAASGNRGASLRSLYTVVRRDSAGGLVAVPYHEVYADQVKLAAAKLRSAAAEAEDPELRRFLELRARALETDDYTPSDLAWLDMKNNTIDVVIGPIEIYSDQLFGYKAAAESYVLIKDKEWSGRLARYASLLPALQRGLPVDAAYKRDRPGTDSDLNAYDAVYYAGEGNQGGKTIAINLPNDEQVQLKKGTRRLQLKNVVRAKFDRILSPIADEMIDPAQRRNVTFEAFFANVMFHEVAHGLGIKRTIRGQHSVRASLKDQASAIEEGKADILGLYLATQLLKSGDLTGTMIEDHYVTFLASILRSVRFGAGDAHGRANAAQISFFADHGAFTRDSSTGRYAVNIPRMRTAVDSLAARLLRLQGDGDYDGAKQFMEARMKLSPTLEADLGRLATKKIPVDVVFEQGADVLGLER